MTTTRSVWGNGICPAGDATRQLTSMTKVGKVGKVWSLVADLHVPRRVKVDKLRDYLRISEAAEYLGVSPNTLRNWVNAGKLVAIRHPVNDYRLFKRESLDVLLKRVAAVSKKASKR